MIFTTPYQIGACARGPFVVPRDRLRGADIGAASTRDHRAVEDYPLPAEPAGAPFPGFGEEIDPSAKLRPEPAPTFFQLWAAMDLLFAGSGASDRQRALQTRRSCAGIYLGNRCEPGTRNEIPAGAPALSKAVPLIRSGRAGLRAI
jgi:hypothetical protein